ncbi:MAG: hypothetical protein DRI32_06120 [Chloroflexi bacterium]|nr:MAG: hypothetical protein DRI32_06120 [Chloroflexota bacterium]
MDARLGNWAVGWSATKGLKNHPTKRLKGKKDYSTQGFFRTYVLLKNHDVLRLWLSSQKKI